jgi:hypothetical protein
MASNGMVMRPEPHINRLELEINGQDCKLSSLSQTSYSTDPSMKSTCIYASQIYLMNSGSNWQTHVQLLSLANDKTSR